ncbi:hypothetical protein LJC57_09940 [Parabacteroides sp. OttesenSCG-928-G07]|nr:hypothetical protein [Parabacteroides sp. OttesenSCG-928-G07]
MKKTGRHILWMILLLFGIGMFSSNADHLSSSVSIPELEAAEETPQDTVPTRFPVSPTSPQEYDDIVKQSPVDLRDPDNVKTEIEYDIRTGRYLIRSKVGDMEITTPLSLTPKEYQDYSLQQSLHSGPSK